MVATTIPGALVRRGKQRIHFSASEETNERSMVPFAVHGQNPLNLRRACGCLKRGVAKKRADCRQAQIARARTDVASLLQVTQETRHERRVDILECQHIGSLVQALMRISEQQPERVAIGAEGVRASLSL